MTASGTPPHQTTPVPPGNPASADGAPDTRADAIASVHLEHWSAEDQPVLERSNTPEMTRYLGGPETPQQIVNRHAKFLRYWETGEASMFRVVLAGEADPVGSIGYWKTEWRGLPVYETGWSIHTAHQGKGIAGRALIACLEHAATFGDADRHEVLAFPRIDNDASNALCLRAGFELVGEQDFEYPKGHPIRVNAWRYDLDARRAALDLEAHRP